MSASKPHKRLVSKGRYVQVMGKKVALNSVAVVTGIMGVLCSLIALVLLCIVGYYLWQKDYGLATGLLVMTIVTGSISWVSLLGCRHCSDVAKSMEEVAPLTDSNAHLLPAQETLLRGSDLPPIVQAELLRATQAGQETPEQELLRATNGEE